MNFPPQLDKLPTVRQTAILKLKASLKNPGRFSILLIGERGTGKSYWLERLAEEEKLKLIVLNLAFTEESPTYWQKQFESADGGVLAIDEADQLSQKNQDILFRMLSTSNGCFGWEEKKLEVCIVFISSKSIAQLRDTEDDFSHQFFDRIGQLIIEMPNLKGIGKSELWRDFMATWTKMNFTTKKPKHEWMVWLERQHQQLHGNFRDLDKICINYDHFQHMGHDEKQSFDLTKKDFEQLFHFPEQGPETDLFFEFQTGMTKKEIDKAYRAQFKRWAKKTYGTFNEAANAMGCSPRSFERM